MYLHCHYLQLWHASIPPHLPYLPKRKHSVHAHACYTVQFHSYLQLVIVLKLYISEQASRSAHVIDDTALHAMHIIRKQTSKQKH